MKNINERKRKHIFNRFKTCKKYAKILPLFYFVLSCSLQIWILFSRRFCWEFCFLLHCCLYLKWIWSSCYTTILKLNCLHFLIFLFFPLVKIRLCLMYCACSIFIGLELVKKNFLITQFIIIITEETIRVSDLFYK